MKKVTDAELNAWRHQFPTAIVSLRIVGDPVYARGFFGEGKVLLHSVINAMKFNNLGQHRDEKRFSDGTVVRVKSVFGQNTVEIDVSKAAPAVVAVVPVPEITCSITFLYIPEEIPPMKYPGQIHAGEVEGVDYIKTYYVIDTTRCPTCGDPDFTVCDTAELAEAEVDCKPFEFVDATIESKEGEPDNHCVTSSSHCQAEIISFGEDDDGTYFLWKGYTEWPPDNQSGLGYMVLRGFIKREGQELCASIETVIKVDCCEKNSDEYKAAHPVDWGDLDIEYTSLVMGCDEEQTLTAKYGCPPFVWTLIDGDGTLTPAEDTLTAIYYSPETNPDCVSNPTIKLEDRCESTKELKLAVNCYNTWAYYQISHAVTDCGGIYPGCNCIRSEANLYNCDGTYVSQKLRETVMCTPSGSNCPPFCMANIITDDGCGGLPPTCNYTWYCRNWRPFETDSVSKCVKNACNGEVCDERSSYAKSQGCCPINPATGLPF